jgi:hypothetical protein
MTAKTTLGVDPHELNAQLPADLLERFRNRFDPTRVADNTYREDNDIVHFVHLPKTAGMSVGKSLQASFDQFYGVDWQEVQASHRKFSLRALYRRSHTPCRQVLMGHYGWNELVVWKHEGLPVKAASILRDPVSRAVSNYNYNSSSVHPNRAKFLERHPTLKSFANTLAPDFQIYRMVGMTSSFEHALEKLIENYTFLGITENLSDSLDYFSRSHGLGDLKEHKINVAKKPEKKVEPPADAVRILRDKSHNDLRLHALLTTLFPKT